jgi:hypothetical protein
VGSTSSTGFTVQLRTNGGNCSSGSNGLVVNYIALAAQ